MTSVRLLAVTKSFGGPPVVDAVDLEIAPGEIFFLLGPSGCGKTTLLRMIAGLIDPTGGRIFFGEREVTNLNTQRRNTAMVFQGYALWPHLTVTQNVAFGLEVRKVASAERRKRVQRALEVTRMTEYARYRPAELSGGQQQRVALARAVVVEPDVLLLDEPLSNLDAKLRHEMRSEIRRICHEARMTAVYVTHDQEEALSIADRIAVMQKGRLSQVGRAESIYNAPANEFVAGFVGQTNFVPATVERVEGGAVVLDCPLGRLTSKSFPAGLGPSSRVTCSIRPESIRILDDNQAAEIRFDACHIETVYLGYLAQHVFRHKTGVQLRISEMRPRPRHWSNGGGETVSIGFNAGDVVVLTE